MKTKTPLQPLAHFENTLFIMKNIAKIENLAPIFGDRGDRKASVVKDLTTLKNAGVNFETYTIKEGETLKFPSFENMTVKEQPVQAGSDTMVYLVACMRSREGRPDSAYWFNLNSLAKRDINNVPVHEEWYDLGNVEARLRKLAELGAIKGGKEVEITVPLFQGNVRVYNDEVQADGTIKKIGATKTQKVATIEAA